MKEMFLTKEGTLTESVTTVMVADDGTICDGHNECRAYEQLGFKPVYPSQITINGHIWHYPSLNGYGLEVEYSLKESWDHRKACFGIDKDGLYLKSVYYWNRCVEMDENVDIGDAKGTRIEDIGNIHINMYCEE